MIVVIALITAALLVKGLSLVERALVGNDIKPIVSYLEERNKELGE